MKIGIVGSGDVAQALGRGLAARGHDVMLGSRDPKSEKLQKWKEGSKGKVSTGTMEETARHGPVVFLSVHGDAAEEAIDRAGIQNFEGKLVVDTMNPLDLSKGMPPGLLYGVTDSLGERVQRKLPRSRVVKAFNTISSAFMADPRIPGGTPELMICGNDAKAKEEVTALAKELGWPGTLDVGGIEVSRWIEALVPLWVRVGMKLGTWHHAVRWAHP